MQDVDENMDELLRKAADHYMLKKGESNWDEIASRLDQAALPAPLVRKGHTKRYVLSALLLLLFFIAGNVFDRYFISGKTSNAGQLPATKTALLPNQTFKNTNEINNSSIIKSNAPALQHKKQQNSMIAAFQTNKAAKSILGNMRNIHIKNAAQYQGLTNAQDYFPLKTPAKPLLLNNGKAHTAAKTTTITEAALAPGKDAAAKKYDSTTVVNQSLKIASENTRHFYFGLLASTEFSTVKNQSFSSPGFDIGIITGYKISGRSSAEIGLLYSKKNYQTDGKYFNMEKISSTMPQGMEVLNLKGSSTVFEIPVKFKYNILNQNNAAVYAAAGVSSYLLTNEKNNYSTVLNGTKGNMKSTYKKSTGYFAAAINLSAGYQCKISSKSTIRFEPYIEIPTTGIGVGKLPVSSSGINILFTVAPH